MLRIFSKTFGIDGAVHQQRDVADLAGPGSLHYDAVEIKVWMLTLDGAVPRSLDLGVDPFVEVGHCARAHPRPPQSFGDILYPTRRNARQIHLDQRLLDRALAAAVPVDDWPAPGSEDTELGVILEPEVVYGTQTLCTRVQA